MLINQINQIIRSLEINGKQVNTTHINELGKIEKKIKKQGKSPSLVRETFNKF